MGKGLNGEVIPLTGKGGEPIQTGGVPFSAIAQAGSEKQIMSGQLTTGSFFNALSAFMQKNFDVGIAANNAREAVYSGDALGRTNPYETDPGIASDNSIAGGALFDRAAAGDPDAVAALKNQANFGFGLTRDAAKNLKDQYSAGSSVKFAQGSSKVFGVSTQDPNQQVQPPPPSPTFEDVVNPGRFQYAQSNAPPSAADTSAKGPYPPSFTPG
jgi:hypothetical protein